MIPRALAGRPWVRRHPFATGILAIATAIFGLMLAAPGDEDRGILLVGISAFALPIVAVVGLVTWLIDRRNASRADAAMADASLAPSTIWPPAAAPVTPRDVASLFKTPPSTSAPPPTELRTPPTADPISEAHAVLAPDMATADLGTYRPITLDAILETTPTELEQRCVRLLGALGYAGLVRIGGAADLGAVTGRDPQGRLVVVRTIRYTGDTLGTDTVQAFVATTAAGPPVDRRILIATADFSQPASRLALEHDVLLVDGDTLVKLLNLTGSG